MILFTSSTPATCDKCGGRTTATFALASGGLCPTCLKEVNATPRVCTSCNVPYLWHNRFAQVVRHPAEPQRVCPGCADKAARAEGNPQQPVIVDRVTLHSRPVVRIDLDLEGAQLCDPAGKAAEGRNPPRRLILKDRHGKLELFITPDANSRF